MGSVDDAPPGTALTSARRPCLHFHCAFWFARQRARAHVALLGPCFKTGRTRPSEYQQHWCTSDTLRPWVRRYGEHCTQSTPHGSPSTGGPAIRRAPRRAIAAHFPRSEWSAGQPVYKLSSERTRPDLPSCQPYGSTPTAAGPCSRGVRLYLWRMPGDTSVTLTAPSAELEPAQSLHQPRSFPSQRFHVLFDSLFKVLFIFPSRYLFAIGLVPIFSFR